MKKVIIVSLSGIGNAGGVERVSQYLAEILGNAGYRIKVLESLKYHFPKFDYFFQSVIMSLRLFFEKKDLVIANAWQAFLYPCDIVFLHGTMQCYTQKIGKFKRLSGAGVIALMEKVAARRAKKVLAVSEHVKKELIELYNINADKIDVLPNCVDDNCYLPQKSNGSIKKILFSGRLEYGKGLAYIKALADYLETIDGWEFHIASNSRMNEDLFLSNTKTSISWGLQAEDMPSFYASGDVLFFPSLYEGFSMSTLEALSSGIPVIGTEYSVTQELADFPFCIDISDIIEEPSKIVSIAEQVINEWCDRRSFIHNCISEKFGKKVYTKEFLAKLEGESL